MSKQSEPDWHLAGLPPNIYHRDRGAHREADLITPDPNNLSGIQESRKGISEIEGKAVRVAASEAGAERVSIEERDFGDRR
jgi:hypothetical protein